MWERERGKRTLTLSDEQYFYAYEAMSAMIADEQRINPSEVKDWLELYFQDYAPELLASLPDEAQALIADLSIGPLTYRSGIFAFVHEVLGAYFLARLLARTLESRKRISQFWNRQIDDAVWRFLPEVVDEVIPTALNRREAVREIAAQSTSGLVMWNIVKSLRLSPTEVPKFLFEGKSVGSLLCEKAKLSGVSFDKATIYDVTFDRCELSGTTFRGARIEKMKFIECGPGARFDEEPLVDDRSEVTVVREGTGPETYVAGNISKLFDEFRGKAVPRRKPPLDLGKQGLFVIFASLFKADGRRPDYPERSKIENRLRAWLRDFELPSSKTQELLGIFLDALDKLIDEGWICRNINRPRTFLACASRQKDVAQIMRMGKVDAGLPPSLEPFVSGLERACSKVTSA